MTSDIKIIDYTPKSIVVFGNIDSLISEFKRLGGIFNRRLKCGPGWIFPVSKRKVIETIVFGKLKILESMLNELINDEDGQRLLNDYFQKSKLSPTASSKDQIETITQLDTEILLISLRRRNLSNLVFPTAPSITGSSDYYGCYHGACRQLTVRTSIYKVYLEIFNFPHEYSSVNNHLSIYLNIDGIKHNKVASQLVKTMFGFSVTNTIDYISYDELLRILHNISETIPIVKHKIKL